MNKVVVSGMGVLSPLGNSIRETLVGLKDSQSGIQYISEWDEYQGMKTRLGAPLKNLEVPEKYDVKKRRSLNKASLLAAIASDQALLQANLLESPLLKNGRTGIAYGSGISSPQALSEMCAFIFNKTTKGINSTTYHRMMSHTCASSLSILYGITGRLIPTSSACTSGSLAIGLAYEQIQMGKQDIMLCGGAEEFHPAITSIFDVLYACSTENDKPEHNPKPFDKHRNGLVVGEGAATLVLESYEHALKRGVTPLAEIIGFGTNCDGYHITNPKVETIEESIRLALESADLRPDEIKYVNAHATATNAGDLAESQAVYNVFGPKVKISSFKGHFGHLLGASGSVEAALSIEMMRQGWLAETKNLNQVDPECAELDYIQDSPQAVDLNNIMSNTFAFGGVNTSLVFKRYE